MAKFDTGMTGRLVISDPETDPWGMLEVPQSLARGVFDAMSATGIKLPEGRAHISVFTSDEINKIGVDNIKERGQRFKYRIRGIKRVEPEGWKEMQYVYFLTCSSPELETLRQSYGLTPRMYGSHPFHITVAVVPKKTVKNIEKKSAADDEEEARRKARRKAVMRAMLLGPLGAGALYAAYRYTKSRQPQPTGEDPDTTVGRSPVEPGVGTEPDLAEATRTSPPPPDPEYAALGPMISEYIDNVKDTIPEEYHQLLDSSYSAVKSGDEVLLESIMSEVAKLPDDDVKAALGDGVGTVAATMDRPELKEYRELSDIGVNSLDVASRPGRKIIATLFDTSVTRRKPDLSYIRGLLKAVPDSELPALAPALEALQSPDAAEGEGWSVARGLADATTPPTTTSGVLRQRYGDMANAVGRSIGFGGGLGMAGVGGAIKGLPMAAKAKLLGRSGLRGAGRYALATPMYQAMGGLGAETVKSLGGGADAQGYGALVSSLLTPLTRAVPSAKALSAIPRAASSSGSAFSGATRGAAAKAFAPLYVGANIANLGSEALRLHNAGLSEDPSAYGREWFDGMANRSWGRNFADLANPLSFNALSNAGRILGTVPGEVANMKGYTGTRAWDAADSAIATNMARAKDMYVNKKLTDQQFVDTLKRQAKNIYVPAQRGVFGPDRSGVSGDAYVARNLRAARRQLEREGRGR